MCSLMNGDVSTVLKSLVEVCGWGHSTLDFSSLFGLLSASHLTFLLAKAGVAAALYSSDKSNQNNKNGGKNNNDNSNSKNSDKYNSKNGYKNNMDDNNDNNNNNNNNNNDDRYKNHDTEILSELLGSGSQNLLSSTLPNEASFVEEMFLESVQRLNELQFPLEVRTCVIIFLQYLLKILILF